MKERLLKKEKAKKQSHAYEGYASTYNVEISNSVNPELQLQDAKSTIRDKLRDLLTELKKIELVTAMVLEFKK